MSVRAPRAAAQQVRRPRTRRRTATTGAAISSSARPCLDELAVDEHADAVGERGRVDEVVRDDDRRQAELAQRRAQLAAHRVARVRVERRERLVEQQDARPPRERARERDALPLAARELARARVGEVGDPSRSSSSPGGPRERDVPRARVRCGKSA